jgi:DNA-binding response OmpR family regulator
MADAITRILLATRDEELAMLLQLEVGDILPESSVNIAASLSDALALAKARRPDLIMLSGDGWAVDVEHVMALLRAAAGEQTRFILVGQAFGIEAPTVTLPVHLPELRAALGRANACDAEAIREDVRPAAHEGIQGSSPAV